MIPAVLRRVEKNSIFSNIITSFRKKENIMRLNLSIIFW